MYREGKKCIIYVRVSTEMQVDGYSLDGQRTILKKHADHEGMEVLNIYEDAGKSGKSIEGRPAFQQMLTDIKNGLTLDFVLVYKLSRFGRNAADILNSLDLLKSYDINLISASEGIDSSQASGKLLISVLSAVSEIERENIIEQTMNGRREKARQGGWNGGFAPYGYDLIDGNLIIAPQEVETIKLIFNLYVNSNYGADKIAKELNLRGIQKIMRQNGKLNSWSSTLILSILDNPTYIGKIAYGRRSKERIRGTKNDYHMVRQKDFILEKGKHDAIITEDMWIKTREKRKEASKVYKSIKGRERVHLLSGLIKCPKCGGPMYTTKYCFTSKFGEYKEHYYYCCSNFKYQRGTTCSSSLKIKKVDIEPYILTLIKSLVSDDDFMEKVNSQISNKTDTVVLENDMNKYEVQLKVSNENKKRLESELDNLPFDINHRDKKIADMNKRLDTLYDTIDNLELKINDLSVKVASVELGRISFEKVKKILINFDVLYELMNEEEKRQAITGIIKEIHVHEAPLKHNYIKSVNITFNTSKSDGLLLEISGDKLEKFGDLSIGYEEKTCFESTPDKPQTNARKTSKKVTYKMLQNYILEKNGFKVHTAYIAEVKRSLGLVMYDAPNKVDNLKNPRHQPIQAKVDAIVDALKHYSIV